MKRKILMRLGLPCLISLFLVGCEAEDRIRDALQTIRESTSEEQILDSAKSTLEESKQDTETKQGDDTVEKEVTTENATDYSITEFDVLEETEGIPDKDTEKRDQLGLTQEGISEILQAQSGFYHFAQLNLSEQSLYAEILRILELREEEIVISSLDEKEIDKAFQCVMNDHPEIFYVSGYTYTKFALGEKIQRISFRGTYTMELEKIAQTRTQIEQYASQCFSGMGTKLSDYEKVKYIYEYIIANTDYELSSLENQNMISVCVYGKSVCQGYAKTMQYLLNRAGVSSTLVIGKVNTGEGHAWNLVLVEGDYYYVDVTWGDAFYRFGDNAYETTEQKLPIVNYDYLCVTSEAIRKTHTVQNIVEMPVCSSLLANYYVREGTYFVELNESQIEAAFVRAYQNGSSYLTLKMASNDVYYSMEQNLIKEQNIFRYLTSETKTIAYTTNEEQGSISFWL